MFSKETKIERKWATIFSNCAFGVANSVNVKLSIIIHLNTFLEKLFSSTFTIIDCIPLRLLSIEYFFIFHWKYPQLICFNIWTIFYKCLHSCECRRLLWIWTISSNRFEAIHYLPYRNRNSSETLFNNIFCLCVCIFFILYRRFMEKQNLFNSHHELGWNFAQFYICKFNRNKTPVKIPNK